MQGFSQAMLVVLRRKHDEWSQYFSQTTGEKSERRGDDDWKSRRFSQAVFRLATLHAALCNWGKKSWAELPWGKRSYGGCEQDLTSPETSSEISYPNLTRPVLEWIRLLIGKISTSFWLVTPTYDIVTSISSTIICAKVNTISPIISIDSRIAPSQQHSWSSSCSFFPSSTRTQHTMSTIFFQPASNLS